MLYYSVIKHQQKQVDKGYFDYMRSQLSRYKGFLPLLLKCGGIFFLFFLTVIVVACGDSSQSAPGIPVPTLTVVFGQFNASPTPPLLPYYCGGWATDTTPLYSANGVVNVFGKFTKTVSGNPEGVAGAEVTATVVWPSGSPEIEHATTSSDGLAVFSVTMQPSAINHVVLVQMLFSIPNTNISCNLSSPAFFTAIIVSPTPSPTNTLSPTASPFGSPTPGGTPTVTPPTLTPSPTRTKTPTG